MSQSFWRPTRPTPSVEVPLHNAEESHVFREVTCTLMLAECLPLHLHHSVASSPLGLGLQVGEVDLMLTTQYLRSTCHKEAIPPKMYTECFVQKELDCWRNTLMPPTPSRWRFKSCASKSKCLLEKSTNGWSGSL